MLSHVMRLVLGDWSNDGHNISEEILIRSNKTIEQIQQAYKDSCKLTGMQFNHNEDYTGRKRPWEEAGKYQIAAEYQDSKVSPECLAILKEFKYPDLEFVSKENLDEGMFTHLWFWFVGLSLPDLQWEKIEKPPAINGWWNKNLNVQFGYGLYNP